MDAMNWCFQDAGMDGIEIDIQADQMRLAEEAIQDIYVVHDKLRAPLRPGVREYLRRNTLEKVIKGFISQGYPAAGKSLYIEIKCDHPVTLDGWDGAVIRGALRKIGQLTSSFPEPERAVIERHIAFASFNYRALERIAELAPGKYDLFLIVASNKCLPWVASKTLYPQYNYLGRRLRQTVVRSRVLTGIWFDPWAMEDFGAVFNRINEERSRDAQGKPLALFVSTYLLEAGEYAHRLGTEKERLHNVKGLIFDIRHEDRKATGEKAAEGVPPDPNGYPGRA
jgi:hypothetical protein